MENKLTKENFENFLNIIEILYGKYYDKKIKQNLIAKNFIYFYDRTSSIIETNISENNNILIENNCAFIFWFYLNQNYENNLSQCVLLQIEILKNLIIEFFLNENFDINVKVIMTNNNQILLLKEQDDLKFNIQKNKWIQLKIQIMKNCIKLNLFQDEDIIKTNELISKYGTHESETKIFNKKYDTKIYHINEKYAKNNNNILDFGKESFNISGMRFFMGYTGFVGTIIFCKNNNPSLVPINSLYGLKNNKISNFLAEIGLSDIFFIFSPNFFMEDKNKFDYLSNNIIGIINNNKILNDRNEIDFNGVYKYKNYINNIFELGGNLNFLLLFEIFYKFTLDNINNSLEKIFIKLIKLIELVIVNKNKNYLDEYIEKNKLFLESLQLFLELIDEKYYQQNDEILNTLINIGKYLYDNIDKITNNSGIIESHYYDYFKYILVYPKLILKYSLKQQNILWNFYYTLKDYRKFFMSFDALGNFMILFSKKYNNESLPFSLLRIIKNIFKDKEISDFEREKLLLLYNSNLLSNNIIIDTIEIFESYLDIQTKQSRRKSTKISNLFLEAENKNLLQINSVNYFLKSQNYFLETLLRILLSTDLKIKRSIINLLRILTQKYSSILEKYFDNLNNETKKLKGKIKRITRNEFYSFIEENILPNDNNIKIIQDSDFDTINDFEIIVNLNEIKRKNSIDNTSYLELNENEDENDTKNFNYFKSTIKGIENVVKTEIKRNKSWNSENIEKIKTRFYNKYSKKYLQKKSSIKIKKNNDNDFNINNINLKTIQNKNFTNQINSSDDKINTEKKIEEENIYYEIAIILIDWLIESSEILEDKNENNKQKQKSNIYIIPLYERILNFITKLLHSNKNLKIINKIVEIFISRKTFNLTDNIINPISDSYSKLLGALSLTRNSIVQLLSELIVNFYLCIYDNSYKKIIENLLGQNLLNEEESIKIIYNHSKELLIDIYFFEKNELRNNIIHDLINIILKLYDGLKNKEDIEINIRKICFNFLNEFFNEIIDIYIKKFSLFNDIKDIEKDIKLVNEKNNLNKHFLYFISFIFEYSLLLFNSSEYIAKIFKQDYINFYGVPDYFSYDSDKKRINLNMDLYLKIFTYLKSFFNVSKLFSNINSLLPTTEIKKTDIQIFCFEIFDINKLIKDLNTNKDLQLNLKKILEILFISYGNLDYNQNNNFPLISIISLLSNYSIDLFIINNFSFSSNNNLNLMQFLNNHQFFIIYLLLIDCVCKENDNYFNIKMNNKTIHEIIYENLLYCIINIIYCINSKYSPFFVDIFNNIIAFISCLSVKNSEKHKFSLSFKKKPKTTLDFSKTSIKKMLNYFSNKCSEFFNNETYKIFANGSKDKNKDFVLEKMTKIYQNIIKSKINNEEQCNLFKLNKFENIYNFRRYELNFKLKLLIGVKKSFDIHKNDLKNYKNIFLKVDELKIPYNDYYLIDSYIEINKKNKYRKLKKELYSWNNSYSDSEVFYQRLSNKKSTKILKYKISNFLSKDMTRKLISPVLDLDYYMPNFKLFDYRKRLFQQENPDEDTIKNIYSIDLKIFENSNINLKNHDLKNYFIENVCYIKTGIHIRGKIFFIKNSENNNNSNNYKENLFFVAYDQYTHEYLVKNNADYDSEHYACFGSIFKNNSNKNVTEKFLKINFNDILYIFIRKYCFRNNSIEFFTSNHKSYYFKFLNKEKRDFFLLELVSILNKNNQKNKLFRSIKGFDEFNKSTIIGYYKDEEIIKDYNNISNIKELWKNNLISNLEYLMWINIYGNRSFRDIQQYPVIPWILNKYDYNTYEELIENLDIRDFRFPMGMLYNDEKSKKRQEGYVETYKSMVIDLSNENLINIKIKDEEEVNYKNSQKYMRYSVRNNSSQYKESLDIYNTNDDKNILEKCRNESVFNINNFSTNNFNKNNERSTKITDYKFDLEKFYYDTNFEYEKIPYCFGSHYSNAMYVSHYLGRIFPYALTMIEIQGDGFDCAERLFINFQKSFNNAISEKGDLRELIPEIFTLPELFININKLNFEKPKKKNKNTEINKINKIINDVILPEWCYKNPYFFIQIMREIFELPTLNYNPWIDLIFGYSQKGTKAQQICNLFLPYAYDGVINIRIKPEDLIKDREENEYRIRAFEMGVHPCKVFDKKNKSTKIYINNQINNIGEISFDDIPEIKIKNDNSKIIFIHFNEELFLIDNKLIFQKLNIQENKEAKELDKKYIIKENISFKELSSIKEILNKNIQSKLIVKLIFKNSLLIISGYFDGSLFMIKAPNNKNNPKTEEKTNLYENLNLKILDNSLITALEIDKNEKYLIYGTIRGSLIIYNLNYNLFKENRIFYHLIKIIKSHSNFAINSISINNDLNLFADCSYDGFVNIYSLPKIHLINSIFIDKTIYNFTMDYVFLSAQPLASIVLYSNSKNQFKCYSINGKELNSSETDINLIDSKYDKYSKWDESMSSPIIFTDFQFKDYLVYILKKKYVIIRQFPSMKVVTIINPSEENNKKKELLSMISISHNNKYLYIMEEKSNKIYIVNCKKK